MACVFLVKLAKHTNMSMSEHNETLPSCSPPTPNESTNADLESTTQNKMDTPTDSETTRASSSRKTYPRFLVVESLDCNKSLSRFNRTVLTKTIEGITSLSTKKQWMGKCLLVKANHEAYSNYSGSHTATSRDCPAYITEKKHSRSKQRLAAHSLQPESKLDRLLQLNRQRIHMPES